MKTVLIKNELVPRVWLSYCTKRLSICWFFLLLLEISDLKTCTKQLFVWDLSAVEQFISYRPHNIKKDFFCTKRTFLSLVRPSKEKYGNAYRISW